MAQTLLKYSYVCAALAILLLWAGMATADERLINGGSALMALAGALIIPDIFRLRREAREIQREIDEMEREMKRLLRALDE